MDGLFLHRFNLQSFQLLVKYLTQVHYDRFVNLLPHMGSEDLDERDFEGRYFTVHENTSQIELDLETNIDVRSVDGW